jgi:predicted transcriptional regulator
MIKTALPHLDEIKARRKLLHLTQQQLARESDVSQGLIAKIENEKNPYNPRYETVQKIFDALNRLARDTSEGRTAGDICTRNIVKIRKNATLGKAVEAMEKGGYSQLPVMDGKHVIGMVTEKSLKEAIDLESQRSMVDIKKYPVEQFMTADIILKDESTSLQEIFSILDLVDAVLVTKKGLLSGIITNGNIVELIGKK